MLAIKLTTETIDRLKKLDEAILANYIKIIALPEEELNAIHRYARISAIGASTRIENALLTDSEINWIDTILTKDGKQTAFQKNKALIEDKLSKDRERSIEEVAGCRNMLFIIYEKAQKFYPLREIDIRALHETLMRPYLNNSPAVGNYKTQPNYVVETNHKTGASRIVFKTAETGVMTNMAMQKLVDWYNHAILNEAWPIVVVCEFVFRFLAIHPFQDGNGRLGRGLFLLGLMQANNQSLANIAKYLAIDRQIEKHKEEYYFVLNACSNGKFSEDPTKYKMEYFLNFMLKIIEESLADIDVYRDKFAAISKLSDTVLKVLECFKENPETRLTTKALLNETGLPRRTINYALTTLLKHNFIQKYGQGAGVKYQITF